MLHDHGIAAEIFLGLAMSKNGACISGAQKRIMQLCSNIADDPSYFLNIINKFGHTVTCKFNVENYVCGLL